VGEGMKENMIYLWGSTGCGLSHLLQACCHYLTAQGHACLYLPLKQAADLSPKILDGLDQLSLIAIDDIDAIAGLQEWEEELFHFYNKILYLEKTKVIYSGHIAAKQLTITLPDLQSRLYNLLSLYVNSLEDHEKLAVLQIRAKARGLEVTKQVGLFLLNRCSRNMGSLFQILEKLDQASLIAQRKLTIPFVKSVLGI
jgi:DnaA family protein